jgi:hypothetical protein
MAKKLNESDIRVLSKEAWDLKRQMVVKHSAAQDIIANKNGYTNWALLKRDFNRQHPEVPLLEALHKYVKDLSDYEIERLFLNGTVWVSLDAVELGKVTVNSFHRFGPRFDGFTRQHTRDLGLIVDMDGMPDAYKLETEKDEDGAWPIVTIKEARIMILDSLKLAVEVQFDSLLLDIEQRQLVGQEG